MKYLFLNTVITGGSNAAANATSAATEATSSGGGLGFFATPLGLVVYILFIVLIFYFIGIRPQKKREKKMVELQSQIKVGDWVLLDSGMYGKVADISDQVFTIEFGSNKTVLIPVVKQRIVAKGEPNFSKVANVEKVESKENKGKTE